MSSSSGRDDRPTSDMETDALPSVGPAYVSEPGYPSTESSCSLIPQESGAGPKVETQSGHVVETSEGRSGRSEQTTSGERRDEQWYKSSFASPSLDTYSFFHRYSDSEKREFRKKLDLISKHFERFPPELKVAYFDVMVLFSEEDRFAANSYCESLNDLTLDNGKRVKATLYNERGFAEIKGTEFGSLDVAFERCTFCFVYLTKEFCKCVWSQIASEGCLMEAIYNKEKRWCVVPVYTVARTKADFRVPMGLNSLKGVNFYNNDEFYRRGLKRLIGDRIYKREDHEQSLFILQYKEAVQMEDKKQAEEQRKKEELKRQRSCPAPHYLSSMKDTSVPYDRAASHDPTSKDSGDSGYLEHSTYISESMDSFTSNVSSSSSMNSRRGTEPTSMRSDSHESEIEDVGAENSRQRLSGDASVRDARSNPNSSSLQVDMLPSFHGRQQSPKFAGKADPLGGKAMQQQVSGDSFNSDLLAGKLLASEDGKYVIHHVHRHIYDTPPKKVVKYNIYAPENVVIGQDGSVIAGAELSDSDRGQDKGSSDDSSKKSKMNTTNKGESTGEEGPSLPSRQSMHMDGLPSDENYPTTCAGVIPKVSTGGSDSGKMETSQNEEKPTSRGLPKHEQLVTKSLEAAACETRNISSTSEASNIANITCVTGTAESVDGHTATASTTNSLTSDTNAKTFDTNDMDTTHIVNTVASISITSGKSELMTTDTHSDSTKDNVTNSASLPMAQRSLPKPVSFRPVQFTGKTNPRVAKVTPLQNVPKTQMVDNEYRNSFTSYSDECSGESQTDPKQAYDAGDDAVDDTHRKVPVGADPEATHVKQVANVSPMSRDLEPDCPGDIGDETDFKSELKSSDCAELTSADKDDQAVLHLMEMGYTENRIKQALASLISQSPGRRHFSVPNLLDEMDKLQLEGEHQSEIRLDAHDLDTDGGSGDFTLLAMATGDNRASSGSPHSGSPQTGLPRSRSASSRLGPASSKSSHISDKCKIS